MCVCLLVGRLSVTHVVRKSVCALVRRSVTVSETVRTLNLSAVKFVYIQLKLTGTGSKHGLTDSAPFYLERRRGPGTTVSYHEVDTTQGYV